MTEVKEMVATDESMQSVLERSNTIQSLCNDFIVKGANSKNIRFNENCTRT